jgi:hypothetical protein
LALRAKNRAFRSNLFCRKAAKKDFRFNPLRAQGLSENRKGNRYQTRQTERRPAKKTQKFKTLLDTIYNLC